VAYCKDYRSILRCARFFHVLSNCPNRFFGFTSHSAASYERSTAYQPCNRIKTIANAITKLQIMWYINSQIPEDRSTHSSMRITGGNEQNKSIGWKKIVALYNQIRKTLLNYSKIVLIAKPKNCSLVTLTPLGTTFNLFRTLCVWILGNDEGGVDIATQSILKTVSISKASTSWKTEVGKLQPACHGCAWADCFNPTPRYAW